MITVETIVAMALRDRVVMDALGEALRSDLVVAHPYLRQLSEFADDFLGRYGKLPGVGDWEVWLETLPEATAAGSRETLGRLHAIDTSGYEPAFFAEQVLPELQRAAAHTATTRLGALSSPSPEAFQELAARVEAVSVRSIAGLAHLSDIDIWSRAPREDDRVPSGFHTLDGWIGGWGAELWIIFADSGVGKSMILQNLGVNAALKGRRVLHVTLELGLRPQIHRYYRQIAQMARTDFTTHNDEAKRRLRHWLRLAQGEVHLIEFPAHSLDPEELRRVIERVSRAVGDIDFLILDYMDLMALDPRKRSRGGYEDLGLITHAVRSYCTEFGMPVLTASQAVRRPEKASRLTLRDMGDSYQKVRGADGILSLVQTEEEAEVHQGRLGILKVRDSGGWGAEIPLYINRELSVIQELDHPNTRALMRQLGHLPAAGVANPVKVTS